MAGNKDPYWWVPPETALKLARRIEDAGTALARVEIRIDKERHGEPMTFRVIRKGSTLAPTGEADLNDSFICPPICPKEEGEA